MSYSNFVQARVVAPVAATATTLSLYAAEAPYQLPALDGGLLVLTDSPYKPSVIEVISYTSRSAQDLLGVVRGLEGTTAVEWSGNVYCYQSLMAGDFQTVLAGKQDAHTNLASLAGLTGAADRLPYFTGAGALSLTTLTAMARSLLDDPDAATMRGTLELGTAATKAVQTSPTDTTAGALMAVGAGGLLATDLPILQTFNDTSLPAGLYRAYGDGSPSPTPYAPPGSGNNTLAVWVSPSAPGVTQFVVKANGNSRETQLIYVGNAYTGASVQWVELLHTGNAGGVPLINLMPDSGRYAGRENPLSYSSGTFANSPFFSSYNGMAVASAGKFIHDNTTYGGARGTLTQDVIDLLDAMGRAGDRYGVEFYIASYTAGTGTASPSTGKDGVARYLLSVNGSRAIGAAGTTSTFTAWVRVKSGSVHTSGPSFHSGVEAPAGVVFPANKWFPLIIQRTQPRGYDNGMPAIYAAPGSIVQIALPAFFAGKAYTTNVSPVPTINELSV